MHSPTSSQLASLVLMATEGFVQGRAWDLIHQDESWEFCRSSWKKEGKELFFPMGLKPWGKLKITLLLIPSYDH